MPPQATYDQIEQLVKKFKALSSRARQAYNEADTRKDFILPMFRAMEWNIDDMREVAAEEKISRGFVDFSFRINGIRRFVLETKRVGEDLGDPRWAKQAIDYAYHKGVTWAVLSDFEALKVFNAEAREANPFQAQFKNFGLDDYLPHLDELWWLSRPAIVEGVLDRQAEKVFKKSIKTPITVSLFDNLKEWRGKLYKLLREYNRGKLYDAKQIDDAVQRILDRLIFIRTAEDREVEGEKLIALVRELKDRGRSNELIPALNQRFRALDRVYNSQLFAPHYSEDLDIGEPSTLAEIINGLYGSAANFTSYNLALIDADVLGRVYEQYLGYVLSEHEELEAKKAKRKSQGIYYTPTFVVKYIVQQTLGRFLEEGGYNAARTVRVLDPACGSGSFLIEAFDLLDQFLARESGQAHGAYDMHDYARHMQILTSNLYGVDKDEQAVEVAQLNLLLKALSVPEKLPKLENIRQGDSLISGTPKELEEYFGAGWKKRNALNWSDEFRTVMADGGFDVIVGNPPYVRIQTLSKDEVAFFNKHYAAATGNYDIYVLFVERALQLLKPGGVLGMILPNKFMQTAYGEGIRKLLADKKATWKIVDFEDAQVFGEATTYTCLLFLRKAGQDSIIYVPAGNYLKTRPDDPDLNDKDLKEISVSAQSLGVNQWAMVDSAANTLLKKVADVGQPLGMIAEKMFQGMRTSANEVYVLDVVGKSRNRVIRLHSQSLAKHVELELGLLKPFLRGEDIKRYSIADASQFVLVPYTVGKGKPELVSVKQFKQSYPLCWEYLLANRKALEERERGKMKHEHWYAFVYPKNLGEFGRAKIVTPDIASHASFALDIEGKYSFVSGYGIVLKPESLYDLHYILGLLNSPVLDFYLKRITTRLQNGFYRYFSQYIGQLPIRRINFDDAAEKGQHDKLVALVEEMLQLQKDYAQAAREKMPKADALKRRIDETDAAIDQIVYGLYGLTDEEIKVVEGAQANN